MTETTIYATVERGISGMYVDVLPRQTIPTYNGLIKEVRKKIDLERLLSEDEIHDKIELGTIEYKNNSDDYEIKFVDIVDTIEEKYGR